MIATVNLYKDRILDRLALFVMELADKCFEKNEQRAETFKKTSSF